MIYWVKYSKGKHMEKEAWWRYFGYDWSRYSSGMKKCFSDVDRILKDVLDPDDDYDILRFGNALKKGYVSDHVCF